MNGYLSDFAFDFVDQHRNKLRNKTSLDDVLSYLKKYDLVELFVRYANKQGLKRRNLLIRKSEKLLDEYIKTAIISDVLDVESTVRFVNESDPCVKSALDLFEKNAAFPSLSVDSVETKE